jgi:hypothetical protein
MKYIALALIGAFVFTSGCMIVRDGKVRPPAKWPPQPTMEKKSLGISVAGAADARGTNHTPRPETIEIAREQALRAYTESGLFSSVAVTDEPTDLRADISVIEDGNDGIGVFGFLSALTFTMIPAYVSEDVIVRTSVSDRTKKVVGTVDKREQQGYWMQFFLLFTMPFTDSARDVSQSLFYDVHRSTIEQAHGQGVF